MSLFKKAARNQAKLRMALQGASGAGKTKTALKIAEHFGRVAMIDTERGSSSLYARTSTNPDGHDFDLVEVASPEVQKQLPKPNFHPENAMFLLDMAAQDHDIIILDSATHFWNGLGGLLDLVNDEVVRMQSRGGKGDSFAAWKVVDPIYRRFVNSLLNCPVHIIVCMRAKQEYEKKDGKVIKLGMAPEMRDQFQFEMSVEGMLDQDHNLAIGKTRCGTLDGRVFNKPGKEVADILKSWLSDGGPAEKNLMRQPEAVAPSTATPILEAEIDHEVGVLSLWQARISATPNIQKLEALKAEIKSLPGDLPTQLYSSYKQRKQELTQS